MRICNENSKNELTLKRVRIILNNEMVFENTVSGLKKKR